MRKILAPSPPGSSQIRSHTLLCLARLGVSLEPKSVALFALVDHSGEAEKVGMKMPPTKLLIFAAPKPKPSAFAADPSICR